LVWDGTKRVDDWLVKYCRAKDTPLNRAIGRKVLIAAVRRVKQPGCKFDYVLVLEGAQGVGKSTLIKLLAGEENYSDAEILGLKKQEQQEAVQGIWLYELAELEGMQRSEVTAVKLLLSKTVDSARPAYGRSRVDRPRRCVFIASTNDPTYLRDMTGNRRFWPVEVGTINLDAVLRDRDQLWAEAVILEDGGEPLVIDAALWGDVAAKQQSKTDVDPWTDPINIWLSALIHTGYMTEGQFVQALDSNGDPEWRIASDYILTEIIKIPIQHQHNNHAKRLAAVMRVLGWHKPDKCMRIAKVVKNGFSKPVMQDGGE
jgi:predicted P-loop ATPase